MDTKKEEDEKDVADLSEGQLLDVLAPDDCDSECDDEHLPAISPMSNISSSSGIFSSSSNSKPTTPTSHLMNDKSDDDCLCAMSITSGNKAASLSFGDEIVIITDNTCDIEKLAISQRCDSEQIESDNQNNRHSSSSSSSSSSAAGFRAASTSKGVKIRSKHRQSRKNFSLDESEIVIYESDSSLQVDMRRRNFHSNRVAQQNMNRPSTASAISRRRSEENSSIQPCNQIVSILKRKDSSTSSNASLVTFSPNVIDIEPRPTHRQGILKKRSSLDESLRYSRSHSPSSASSESEKGCLKSTRRRNSSEELNHHGILKQKSYDSSGGGSAYSSGIGGSSGGCNTPNSSSGVQGILKKPSLTPSDHSQDQPTKHVSISEAVILAAAELCKDMIIIDDQSESYIKPILKLDYDHPPEQRPKPILKKNHSSENEGEIRSILKSRKSSREELQDDL